MLGAIYNTILYQPLLNLLVLFYQYLPGHDFGVAIIILTILIRLLLYPLGVKSIKSQKALSEIQPKIKEIQEKYKNEKEKQVKAIMEVYQKAKINPFSGLILMAIQLPVFIALYQVLSQGLDPKAFSAALYSFVPHVDKINSSFFGLIDLSQPVLIKINGVNRYLLPNIILVAVVGIAQFIQMKMTMVKTPKADKKQKKEGRFSNAMQKQMLYFFPIFTVFILWKLPAALGFYWLITTLFSIVQQHFIFKKKSAEI